MFFPRLLPFLIRFLLIPLVLLANTGAQNLTGDLWTKPTAPLGVSGVLDITVKGSEYWAVGVDGVFKSANLTAWSKVATTGLTDTLFCIRWTGTRFVAAGYGCWTSTDGIAWTQRATFGPQVALGMTFRGTTVVAGGVLGAIHHSADGGLTWTRVDLGQNLFFTSLTSTATHFVAAGTDGVIYNSTDGLTWTQRNSTTARSFWDVTLAGTRLVAVGDDLTVATSADNGNTWASYQAATGTGLAFRAVAGDATATILLTRQTVVRTTNPTVPSSLTYQDLPAIQSEMTCIVRGTSGWACGGYGSAILTSPDANTWTLRHPLSAYNYFTASRTSSHFMTAGFPGDHVMRSTDGISWAAATSGIPVAEGVTAMAWSGSRLVAATASGKIYSTTAAGGTGFTLQNSGTTQRLHNGTWTGTQFLLCGNGGTILSSTNGTAWAARTSGTGLNLYGVASSGSVHVVCGGNIDNFSTSGVILTSTNGISWSQAVSLNDNIPLAVAWNGSSFAAVGSGGLIMTSPDGQQWTARTALSDSNGQPFGKIMQSITWAGTNWIATTEAGGVVLSTDGIDWRPQDVAGSRPLNAVIYGASKAVIAGEAGQILTSTATAPRAPVFLIPPMNATVEEGLNGVLTALATGTPGLLYQWRKEGTALPGGDVSTFAIPAAQAGDSGSYDLVVTGPGGSITSTPVTVRVKARPAITQHPAAQQAVEGSTVELTVAAAGAGPLTYQWFKAGTGLLSGRTAATLTLTAVTPASSGEYYAEVTNEYGISTSAAALLTVTLSLTNALDLPPGTPVATGGNLVWTGTADDAAELRTGTLSNGIAWMEFTVTDRPGVMFDWMASGTGPGDELAVLVDSVPVLQFSGPRSLRTGAVPTGAGTHTVRWLYSEDGVADFSGLPFVRVDHVVLLTASSPPVIGADPLPLTVSEGAAASFKVVAAGGGTLSYQWRKGGIPIPGATAAEYTISPAGLASAGLYSVAVSNAAGTVVSGQAALAVSPALATALDLPAGIAVITGGSGWDGISDFHHDGTDAAASRSTPASGNAWLEISVTGMTAVSFWWNVSSESCCDHFRFFAGGTAVDRISGVTGEWRQVTTALNPAVPTTLRWEYSKDNSVADGLDRAWLDQVVLTPLTAVTDFPLWAAALPPGKRAPADRNGPLLIENTMAYALGIDPQTAAPSALPQLARGSGGTWQFTYTRTRRTTGAGYRVEWSANPAAATWSTAGIVHEQTATGADTTTWRATFTPPPGTPRAFLRLRVALEGFSN